MAVGQVRCDRCGEIVNLYDGHQRVQISLTANELAELAIDASNPEVRKRLLCALGLLDRVLADALREGMYSGE